MLTATTQELQAAAQQDKDLDVPHVLTFYFEPPKGMPKNLYLESVTGKNQELA